MHCAARVWPLNAQDSAFYLGPVQATGEDMQLRRRNAQRLLLDGNAEALLGNPV